MLSPRRSTNTVLVCAQNSRTYIILTMAHEIVGGTIQNLIAEASNNIANNIDFSGDGPISNGQFNWLGDDEVHLEVWNTNNHQATWGVVNAALSALADYMSSHFYGAAFFTNKDGANEVGEGVIG